MGGQTTKKAQTGDRNASRRNGKAWKKRCQTDPKKTPERLLKDSVIRVAREIRREDGRAAAVSRMRELMAMDSVRKPRDGDIPGYPFDIAELRRRIGMALPKWYKQELERVLLSAEARLSCDATAFAIRVQKRKKRNGK